MSRKQHLLELFFMVASVIMTLFLLVNMSGQIISISLLAAYAIGGTFAGYGFRALVLAGMADVLEEDVNDSV